MEGKITIAKRHYLKLIVESEILNRLVLGDVDDWEWYEESMNPKDIPSINEFTENERIRISKI